MNLISAERLSVSYGERSIFNDLTFGFRKGDKVGMVASNGSGKSTILKILARKLKPDSGEVSWKTGIRVGFLSQEPEFDDALSIEEQIERANSDVADAVRAYHNAIDLQQQENSHEHMELLNEATDRMDELGAWDYDRKLKELLSKFKIRDLSQNIGQLSGGQKKRLALAIVLLGQPEVLLLDEPTNHLDIDMIEWLEKYLSNSQTTIVMVTHDRYFLDEVCSSILELYNGKLYKHQGNYGYYLEKKSERLQTTETTRDKEKKFLKDELEWIRRSPKARGTKSKSRIKNFEETTERLRGPKNTKDFKFDIKEERVGGKILELKRISKAYDENELITRFDYVFKKGERIGIVGPNGSGKSTLLNIIMELLEPDAGKVVKGETISFGYYKQDLIHFKEDQRVIDTVKEVADVIETANGASLSASLFLKQFDFDSHKQYTLIKNLSGGERRRLHLIMVLMKNPNFLILDEPTNDLDLLTLNKLEEFLWNFQGCILLVSHDRYFLDKLVDHIFIFDGKGSIKDYIGSYSQYRNELAQQEPQIKKDTSSKEKIQKQVDRRKKLSYKEKFEFEQLGPELEKLEKEKEDLEILISQSSSDYIELQKHSKRHQEVVVEINEKEMRWLELSELSE